MNLFEVSALVRARISTVIGIFAILVASAVSAAEGPKLSRTLPLVRADGTIVAESPDKNLPKGTVKLEIKGSTQRVTIDAYNLFATYDPGLAVYLGDAPQITNSVLQYVGVLSKGGTNGHWRLRMESSNGQAPPQFVGFDDLTQLEGLTFFIVTGPNDVLLRANVTTLVPNPAKLSFRGRSRLEHGDPSLSPKAGGYILAKYNGRTGASVLTVRGTRLNKGNRYVAGVPREEPISEEECDIFGYLANKGVAIYSYDSGKGDELPFGGSDTGVITAYDLVGIPLVIQDCFGGAHLFGTIPGP